MSKGNGEFNHQDGISLRTYFEAIFKELRQQSDDKIRDLGEKINAEIIANDKLYSARFTSSDNAVREAFNASQTAITKSETGQEKRNDAVYVSIATLQKALSEVIARSEFNLSNKNVDEKYDILKKAVSDIQLLQTRFLTVDAYEVRHNEIVRQIADLRETRSIDTGKGQGLNSVWVFVIGAVSIVALFLNALRLFEIGK